MANRSIDFFDAQFRRQVADRDFALNPFEQAALPFVRGRVLDLGCGLGNLAIAAARRGAHVVAVDASLTAVVHITIVAIGLLMFMARAPALALLDEIREHVAPGGCAVLNVLVEGTTYMDMFDPAAYCLFGRDEIEQRFAGWRIELSRHDRFAAPGDTVKAFSTVVARRPAAR